MAPANDDSDDEVMSRGGATGNGGGGGRRTGRAGRPRATTTRKAKSLARSNVDDINDEAEEEDVSSVNDGPSLRTNATPLLNRPTTASVGTSKIDYPDQDTIRIMISTDNHLGYAEDDNVRGDDSFAALEEVLYLAKHHRCDMVLLAGDLFHENRPTRRTIYKTSTYLHVYMGVQYHYIVVYCIELYDLVALFMSLHLIIISFVSSFYLLFIAIQLPHIIVELFRRYCMGHEPIQIRILPSTTSTSSSSKSNSQGGNNSTNIQSSSPFVRGFSNYEDEFYSVDLPVFAIHGNHDDPSRDGGNSDLYAALDLLDVANLVNYFGKQEDSKVITIDPILFQKGSTYVAMYGLGSMRDERLNRMWRSEQVSFSRPDNNINNTNHNKNTTNNHDDENDDETCPTFFNIFALHQNRDYGRGTKNCIKEDMIPEWMVSMFLLAIVIV
jgi:DNA repair exonuclease SbcCD nuclease subunit